MRHPVVLCDNRKQDEWIELYYAMAEALTRRLGLRGRSVVREGVRRYASTLGGRRRSEILNTANRVNLDTIFACGFGLPCGDRSRKEWIRCEPEELFFNVVSCPFRDSPAGRESDLGVMFCEEYYPALVHAATSAKAQINLGSTLMNGRDDFCRLSFYLRPANLDPAERAECFPEHCLSGEKPAPLPGWKPDYAELKELLYLCFGRAARDLAGDAGASALEEIGRKLGVESGSTDAR